jgi:hypothetical protein
MEAVPTSETSVYFQTHGAISNKTLIFVMHKFTELISNAVPLHAMVALGGESALALGKVHLVQEAGWTPEPVWTQRLEGKSFASAGDRTLIAR